MASPDSQPGTGTSLADQAIATTKLVNKIFWLRINALTSSVSESVLAVSNAFSMHADEVASAYAGTCPDQGPDIDPLDLDARYVVLLDALRRTRPDAYAVLVQAAVQWHQDPPLLYEQPLKMGELASHVAETLAGQAPPQGACSAAVAAAASAALSSARSAPATPVARSQVGDSASESS